jgi:hypothetical protein
MLAVSSVIMADRAVKTKTQETQRCSSDVH